MKEKVPADTVLTFVGEPKVTKIVVTLVPEKPDSKIITGVKIKACVKATGKAFFDCTFTCIFLLLYMI